MKLKRSYLKTNYRRRALLDDQGRHRRRLRCELGVRPDEGPVARTTAVVVCGLSSGGSTTAKKTVAFIRAKPLSI
jgi:hypothetical protein